MVVPTDFLSFRRLRRVFHSAHPNRALCRRGERFCVSVLFICLASRLLPHYTASSLVQMLFSISSRGGRRKKKRINSQVIPQRFCSLSFDFPLNFEFNGKVFWFFFFCSSICATISSWVLRKNNTLKKKKLVV